MGPSPMRTQTRVVPRNFQIETFFAGRKSHLIQNLRKLEWAALDRDRFCAIFKVTQLTLETD
ncbi:hypothetical protein CQ059_03715 [Brucella pseudogrignonensis]|jgi:hypothetical protein|nr:hypothetical protein A8A54_03400 [Brucella pseudogrignonensis]EMG54772.1 hypothetical protein WYI_05355 [Ochrobactrum sp. CDB2]GLU26865.1 hypothetical protein Brsp01_20980 [Brucella sp. NBRC 12950]PQZ43072.1 hypothetical protein CQ059_03715 [Brucella pseudogrignonensis]PRA42819.1 hypothetical protein CQ063_00200 [Brucella pseudogrignonensis]